MLKLDYDATTGLAQEIEYSYAEDKTAVRTTQDVSSILERNKKLQNAEAYKKAGIDANMQHVASIPLVVVHEWMKEGIDIFNRDHWPMVRKKLMESENRHLRTTLGNI